MRHSMSFVPFLSADRPRPKDRLTRVGQGSLRLRLRRRRRRRRRLGQEGAILLHVGTAPVPPVPFILENYQPMSNVSLLFPSFVCHRTPRLARKSRCKNKCVCRRAVGGISMLALSPAFCPPRGGKTGGREKKRERKERRTRPASSHGSKQTKKWRW